MSWMADAWKVLMLFVIPIGGGIPAGVLLAQRLGFAWPVMMILYLISDVMLACVFEPIMMGLVGAGKRSPTLSRVGEAFQKSIAKTTSHYGTHLGPLSLVLVAFGVDPMTGRLAAAAAGHGFIWGWAIAIAGDMLYFSVLMISTLWLNGILGDETRTTLLILVGMMVIPPVIRKIKSGRKSKSQGH